MMRVAGTALLVLGLMLFTVAAVGAANAPNVSYAVGTFLPGLLCLIIGLRLIQPKKPADAAGHNPVAAHPRRNRRGTRRARETP
jgi:hypothetical protein